MVDVAGVGEEHEVAGLEARAVGDLDAVRPPRSACRSRAGSGRRTARRPTASGPSSRTRSAASSRPTCSRCRGTSTPPGSRPAPSARARCRPRSPPAPARGSRPGAWRRRPRRRSPRPRRDRRPAATAARAPRRAARRRRREQPVGLLELGLVAAAVLRGGALDVGDPLAELVRVGDRLARDEPLALDRLGLVEEPLDLQLGLLRVAGVGALVPDPDAHLEEADRVGVAEVEVLHARLDERGHQRQLRRQPALLRLAGHPGGDLLARRVVARVGVGRGGGDGGGVDGRAGGLRRRRRPRRRPGGGRVGRGGARLRRPRRPSGTACESFAAPRLASASAALAVTAFRNICELLARLGRRLRPAAAAAGGAGRDRRRPPAHRRQRARPAAATSAGGFQSAGISCLKPMCRWFWWARVGEVAGAGDRERRADLVRADVRVQRGELARDLARERAARADDLAVDRARCPCRGRSGGWRPSRRR